MGFIGNDIINWQSAKTHQHKLKARCLEKLFNPSEIHYIEQHVFPLLAYWHLWSVKESAYKAWQRANDVKPIYNAISFVCSNIQQDSVVVEKDDFRCKVNTSYSCLYIYSQCYSEKFQTKIFDSQNLYKSWLTLMAKKNWIIEKSEFNIPSFYNTSSLQKIPVSISNDGNHVGVVWQI
jgi:phosphopantetheinyl transferase (holo-ACP synthase)